MNSNYLRFCIVVFCIYWLVGEMHWPAACFARSRRCTVSSKEGGKGTRSRPEPPACNHKVKSHATQVPKFPTAPVQMQDISQASSQRLPMRQSEPRTQNAIMCPVCNATQASYANRFPNLCTNAMQRNTSPNTSPQNIPLYTLLMPPSTKAS